MEADDRTARSIVGRAAELDVVRAAVADVVERRGGALVLTGPAGVGKSRIAQEAAPEAGRRGAAVLRGRAVAGPVPLAYRPLVEALAPWARTSSAPDLGPHTQALGVLLAGADATTDAQVSPVFVAEALLRLLPTVTGGAPAVLVVEDLHWADAETLVALEYLADAAADARLLLLLTTRDDEGGAGAGARRLVRALAARGAATVLPLAPLDAGTTRELAEARLGEPVSPALVQLLVERTDGLPLFLEELLVALRAADGLRASPDGLDARPTALAVLPESVADAAASRLAAVDAAHHDVLTSAALLGRSFDHGVLAEVHGPAVTPALQQGTAVGLLHEDPDRAGRLRFRHALLRDGVLAAAFPPRRAELARALLDAVLRVDPDATSLDAAVPLAVAAGDDRLGAWLAVRRAVAAYDIWALTSAERWLEHARSLAGDDAALRDEIDLQSLRVASVAGRLDDVERLALGLLARAGTSDEVIAVESHLRLALARLADGRWEEAEAHHAAAAPLVAAGADACTATRLELQRSTAALLQGDRAAALALAVRAGELARLYDDQVDLVVAALVQEGRAALPDVATASARWHEALAVADAAGFRLWRGRVLVELASLHVGAAEALDAAEQLGHEAGAVELLVRVRLLQAAFALQRGDLDGAERHLADPVLAGSPPAPAPARRKAAQLAAAAVVLRGGPAPDDDPALVLLAALVADDLDAAGLAAAAVEGVLRPFADVVAPVPLPGPVADARGLLPDLAAAAAALRDAPLLAALLVRAHAPAAGDVRQPLQDALAAFERLGLTRPAEACRALLRDHGVPLPRRTTAQHDVPEALRAAGVTTRELEVLLLVAEGRTNREVAAALFLSPRTVEKHVERLLLKTGAANRTALAALAPLRTSSGPGT